MRSDFMIASMIGSDGSSMTWITPSGAPASSAARASSRAASAQQAFAIGVRGDDDGVARQERDDRLVEDRADRVGRRRQREDRRPPAWGSRRSCASRSMRKSVKFQLLVMLEEPDRAEPVLDLLVIGIAEAGLRHRPLGIFPRAGAPRFRRRLGDLQHLVARKCRERRRRPARLLHHLRRPVRRQLALRRLAPSVCRAASAIGARSSDVAPPQA